MGRGFYGEEDECDWLDGPGEWDESEEDQFDPEPTDDELWNEFDLGDEPEEEEPPEELWSDADWE